MYLFCKRIIVVVSVAFCVLDFLPSTVTTEHTNKYSIFYYTFPNMIYRKMNELSIIFTTFMHTCIYFIVRFKQFFHYNLIIFFPRDNNNTFCVLLWQQCFSVQLIVLSDFITKLYNIFEFLHHDDGGSYLKIT